MKYLFTILFFADTLLLILLTFLFLRLLDKGITTVAMILILTAIVLCILLLAYFLSHYMKIPPSDNHNLL